MDLEQEIEVGTSPWGCILPGVISHVCHLLVEWKVWRYTGARLRLVNRHWRSVVDDHAFHVSMPKFPNFPFLRDLPLAIRGKKITSFYGGPLFSRRFKFSSLGNPDHLAFLRSVRFSRVENIDDVLIALLPLSQRITQIHIDRGHWTQIGIDALGQFCHVTALRLNKMLRLKAESPDYDFTPLGNLTKLRHFTFELCRTGKDLAFMDNFTQLETFDFDTFEPVVKNFDVISHLPNLTAMSVVTSDMINTDLRFIYSLDRLTALNINSDLRKPPPCYTKMPRIRKLGTLSRQKKWILDGLNEDRIFVFERIKAVPVYQEPQRLLVFGDLESEQHLIRNLTALDIADISVSISTLRIVAKMKQLEELRMHMCRSTDDYLRHLDHLHFPALKTWTINAGMHFAGKFALSAMPKLENLGVWSDFDEDLDYLADLTLLPRLHHIAFAMGVPWEKQHLWEVFEDAMDAFKCLKHIGWKDYKYKRFVPPRSLVNHFERRGILFDQDITVFQLFTF